MPVRSAPALTKQKLHIVAGDINTALSDIAAVYNINILYQSDTVSGITHAAIDGNLSYDEALTLLLDGTSLYVQWVDTDNLIIRRNTDMPEPLRTQQRTATSSNAVLNEVIVTGTRQTDRTLFSSLSPVDVLNTPMAVGSVEMIDSLAAQLPGFTAFRLPLSDGQIFNRTSGLRGLNSDHTLILVNGKRRHRSAFLETADGQPIDLAHIPMYAVSRVEVLRDGASAMYGSDAIAGVINVILERSDETAVMVQGGQYYAGDGQSLILNARHGWVKPDNSGGSITLSAFDEQPTSRAEQPADALTFQQQHPDASLPNPVQRWGQPERRGQQLAFNLEEYISQQFSLYGFGTLSESTGRSDFNWRNPDTNELFAPTQAFPGFDFKQRFPLGFTPSFGQNESDMSLTVGTHYQLEDTRLNISASHGQNIIRYFIDDTVNASLGPASPTSFRPGRLTQRESSVEVDYIQTFTSPFTPPITLASGLSLRQETYQIRAGDDASWAIGPAAWEGLPAGANGFPGYTASQAGTFRQTSKAAYVDITLPISTRLEAGLAIRYENYSLFSGIVRGKFSARYQITPGLMIRTTVSNGFRAPTSGQMFSERTSQALNAGFNGISTRGRLSPLSPVADVLSQRDDVNIKPLDAEQSFNLGAGIGYQSGAGGSIQVDWYRIDLTDRFGTTPIYELTAAERNELREPKYGLDYPIDTVNFFQNLFDTRTEGIDVVARLPVKAAGQRLLITGALNVNRTTVTDDGLASSEAQKVLQEKGLPRTRAQLSAAWQFDHTDIIFTWRYTGTWQDLITSEGNTFQTFSAMDVFDVSVLWYPTPRVTFKFGIENLFNQYPDRARLQANRGLKYSRNSPYDTDGGAVYLRYEHTF